MRKNTIRIIYGPGNGKSASAVGYGLLGALAGKKVIIVQFLKGVLEERSLEILERMDLEMKVFRFERSRCYFEDLPEDQKKEETMNLRNGFNFAKKVMATGECDLLILDEVLGLVDQGGDLQGGIYPFPPVCGRRDGSDHDRTGLPRRDPAVCGSDLLCGKSVMAGDPGPVRRKFKS